MEVLIKAKQANNPQFAFLSVDGALNPYYKLVLEAIKSEQYNPEKQPEKEESGTHFILYFIRLIFYITFSISTSPRLSGRRTLTKIIFNIYDRDCPQ